MLSCDTSVKVKKGLGMFFLFVLYFKLLVNQDNRGNLGAYCFCSLEMAHRK